MTRFKNGQHVRVCNPQNDDRAALRGRNGQVVRLRFKDELAWVRMYEPLPPEFRVFPDDDERADHILLDPDECEVVSAKLN